MAFTAPAKRGTTKRNQQAGQDKPLHAFNLYTPTLMKPRETSGWSPLMLSQWTLTR
jgi:hypothetical protein